MKKSTSIRSQKGVALVIVLAFLVLITGIILAFFTGVTTERNYSKTSADAATSQQLANSAVNIVMAQIVDATKGTDTSGSTLAWASQPGMIRTYDTSGNAGNYYKLYSSDQMVIAGSGFSVGTETPGPDWCSAANAGIYVDLNTPVLVFDTNGLIVSGSNKYSADYPVMDPMAEGYVDGFSITSRPGSAVSATGSGSVSSSYDPTQTPPAGETSNPAPMPVKWLYVLKNGKVVSPSTTGTPGVLNIPGCTLSNPVTGRIAFWADDDTSKVNINTASEGVYWDTPRIFSFEDTGMLTGNQINTPGSIPGMAICQPVQKEYQRYPGHPATTCLSPIFAHFGLPVQFPWQPWMGTLGSPASGVGQFNSYYAMSPRVPSGGSNAGTVLTGTTVLTGSVAVSGASALVPRQDRLYASIDELMFAPQLSGSSRMPNTSGSSLPNIITKNVLEQTKFFITANSVAPETTLFNTPRISMWPEWDSGPIMASGTVPVSSGTVARTTYDNLAAFCGTIGGTNGNAGNNTYFFTRAQARSDTYDYSEIQRNQTLYKYLRTLTTLNIPGFGGNFSSKYGADRDQILTMMFDYIRCINLADSSTTANGGSYPYSPLFIASGSDSGNPYSIKQDMPNLFPLGAGEVVPIKIDSTMGVGRFLTISEADLLFYGTHSLNVSGTARTNKMRAVFLVQFASPMQGMSPMRSSLKYTVTGLDGFAAKAPTSTGTYQSVGMPGVGTNLIEISDSQLADSVGIGGVEGPAEGLYALGGIGDDKSIKSLSSAGGAGSYPFYSASDLTFTASGTDQSFQFKGNDITITLMTQGPTPVTVQTIKMHFPDGIFKIPDVLASSTDFSARLKAIAIGTVSSALVPNGNAGPIITGSDTVFGVQSSGVLASGMDPSGGDYRMIAPMQTVPPERYRPHSDYTTGSVASPVQFAHGLMTSLGLPYWSGVTFANGSRHPPTPNLVQQGRFGKLVPVPFYIGYSHNASLTNTGGDVKNPYVPSFVGDAVKRAAASGGGPGDWDTGVGNVPDGAYMNKPDEGDTRTWAHLDNTVPRYPYQLGSLYGEAPAGNAYFSPNRQVPSPMMFGSIPTGVQRFLPWQTLLFNPKPEDANHPGKASPEDHLFADLFWMPVVEPYAISQPFSTAGKINLNYQIMPFTYIKRQTGLEAVLKATQFAAIPLTDGTSYKPVAEDTATRENDGNGAANNFNANRRHVINIPETLRAFDTKFSNSDIYRSATEICDVNLVPMPLSGEPNWTLEDMAGGNFWNQFQLTGDNLREKPYVDIYARLTTKSNTYTVHYYVQPIKQNTLNASKGVFVDPNGSPGGGRDNILSEYRGSTIIERYIDVNDPSLPDFAAAMAGGGSAPSIDPYYKFRVVSTKRFAP